MRYPIAHSIECQALLEGLFEANPDVVIVTDWEGRIIEANPQIERVFWYTGAELSGQPIETLIPERFRPAHLTHRMRYATTPHDRPMGSQLNLYGRRKDGFEFAVDVALSPF